MNSDMESGDYLNYLVREIHTTVVATVDDDDLSVTAAIDTVSTWKPRGSAVSSLPRFRR